MTEVEWHCHQTTAWVSVSPPGVERALAPHLEVSVNGIETRNKLLWLNNSAVTDYYIKPAFMTDTCICFICVAWTLHGL